MGFTFKKIVIIHFKIEKKYNVLYERLLVYKSYPHLLDRNRETKN